jgi:hypothetical protein
MHRRARHWLEIEKEARALQDVDVSFYRRAIIHSGTRSGIDMEIGSFGDERLG